MNLLKDRWLPVQCLDGSRIDIGPAEIVRQDIVDFACPRSDFQGGLYQFLIGLLQTGFAPNDYDEWEQLWTNPPPSEQLDIRLSPLEPAFELFSPTGHPAFLQDLMMDDGGVKSIASLLIEAPGGKTLKDNLDHFVKGKDQANACESCAATALFTLQTNAPSGGVGHRVGLRGGGPLTTLILPPNRVSSLWHKLWLNILVQEELAESITTPIAEVFPWIARTRVSNSPDSAILPQDAHPLQMYWGMPRRVRLKQEAISGVCSICGKHSTALTSHYTTRNYGMNYEGPWQHPLTPYRLDSNNDKPPLSLKGQPGGLGYRHWLGMNWGDSTNGDTPALSVSSFYAHKMSILRDFEARLWCFGYDMDNMKSRCWYENHVPALAIPAKNQTAFKHQVSVLMSAAKDAVRELRQQIKSAWFARPQDVKGDTSMIDASFWEATEVEFYAQLHRLTLNTMTLRFMPEEIGKQWAKALRWKTLDLFDYWALTGEAESMDMKRITKARRMLLGKLMTMKSLLLLDKMDDKESV